MKANCVSQAEFGDQIKALVHQVTVTDKVEPGVWEGLAGRA